MVCIAQNSLVSARHWPYLCASHALLQIAARADESKGGCRMRHKSAEANACVTKSFLADAPRVSSWELWAWWGRATQLLCLSCGLAGLEPTSGPSLRSRASGWSAAAALWRGDLGCCSLLAPLTSAHIAFGFRIVCCTLPRGACLW